jgi:phage terminase large subunit-like protein
LNNRLKTPFPKRKVEEYLNEVNYDFEGYMPSLETLKFINFIKEVNGGEEENETPVVHMKMIDNVFSPVRRHAILAHRGIAKSSLFGEYLILWIASFGYIPNFGKVPLSLYVSDSIENGVKNLRRNVEFRFQNSEYLEYLIPRKRLTVGSQDGRRVELKYYEEAVQDIKGGYKFTDIRLEFENRKGQQFVNKGYGVGTGVRGTKEKGTRPYLAILDDLISSDDEARSKIILQSIKNTIYKDVSKALHPKFQKIIYVGTPFNQSDPLYEAIESGAWKPSVFPICEHFDANTTKEEFKGSWEDRFPFEYVQSEYIEAIASIQPQAFYQELMLRITSTEDLLLEESDIGWYDSVDLIEMNKQNYNFYIVTDLAVTAKASADYSTVLVFAFSNEGILYYVNGFMEKVTIDKPIDKIFEFVKHYNPFEIGIERSGQQGAIVTMIQKEAYRRGIYSLRLGRDKGSKEFGFNSTVDKVTRFNSVVPMFKMNMIKFPRDKADSKILTIGLEQIRLINPKGYSTKNDDFGDAIAMLSKLTLIKPEIQKPQKIITEQNPYDKYFNDETAPVNNNKNIISSYIN